METTDNLDDLRCTLKSLQDRQDILDCIVREARGRDRQDSEMITGCYWEDGGDEHGPSVIPASEYAAWANAGHAAFFCATSHNITNHSCEIDGDTAYCETYVVGFLLSKNQQNCKIAPGRYIDKMERRNGEWRIKNRRTIVDMACEGDARWLHSGAMKGFLKGLWSREDPSYKRPVAPVAGEQRW